MNKYVFDLSRVPTMGDIKRINDISESKSKKFDLITCCHVLEHVSSPIEVLEQIKCFSHEDTIFYLEVPLEDPFDIQLISSKSLFHYFIKKIMFMNPNFYNFIRYLKRGEDISMHEHVNFFSVKSLTKLLEKEGFSLIFIDTNELDFCWCKLTVLSFLAKLKKF